MNVSGDVVYNNNIIYIQKQDDIKEDSYNIASINQMQNVKGYNQNQDNEGKYSGKGKDESRGMMSVHDRHDTSKIN